MSKKIVLSTPTHWLANNSGDFCCEKVDVGGQIVVDGRIDGICGARVFFHLDHVFRDQRKVDEQIVCVREKSLFVASEGVEFELKQVVGADRRLGHVSAEFLNHRGFHLNIISYV